MRAQRADQLRSGGGRAAAGRRPRIRRLWKDRAFFQWRYVPGESRRAYRMACTLFWSILLYFAFQRYVISFDLLVEPSMQPTMIEGQAFLVNRYIYAFTRPRRGDVVALRLDRFASEQYVKRVVALEGEVLAIRRGVVFINGRPLREPYAAGSTWPEYGPYRIPAGYYFVLGDNRPRSYDSRLFGPVSRRDILGRLSPGRLFEFL
jgi:signal peptidase I